MSEPEVLLRARAVTKRFGGLAAVDGVSFDVRAGETFGIAGPNGAGKTTLFDVLTGMSRITSGEVLFGTHQLHRASVHRIAHWGVARTFQHPSVFDTETVLANAVVGAHYASGGSWWNAFRVAPDVRERAEASLDFVGLLDRSGHLAGRLSIFDKKRLMIASALAGSPTLLFLDEPFGGLTPSEVDALIELLGRLRSDGITLVLIEHVMRALIALSDRVLIMNQGKALFEGTPSQMITNEEVIRVYLGGLPVTTEDEEVAL